MKRWKDEKWSLFKWRSLRCQGPRCTICKSGAGWLEFLPFNLTVWHFKTHPQSPEALKTWKSHHLHQERYIFESLTAIHSADSQGSGRYLENVVLNWFNVEEKKRTRKSLSKTGTEENFLNFICRFAKTQESASCVKMHSVYTGKGGQGCKS